MPEGERKATVTMTDGTTVTGVDVPINEASERWSELHLGDGAIIRVKQVVAQVVRLEGHDSEGNPIYVLKAQPVMAIVSAPESLRKKD